MSESVTSSAASAGASLADPDALDALVDAGFDLEDVDPSLRGRCSRHAALLRMIDIEPESPDGSLVDLTLLRVQRSGVSDPAALCPDDKEALDALVMSGYRPERAPGSLRSRAAHHAALAELVLHTQVRDRFDDTLTDRTLARVQAEIDAEEIGRRIESRRGPRRGLRLADVVSVAAVFLIGASLIWPALSAGRSEQVRLACASSMRASAMGLSSYAMSHDGSLPVVTAGAGGSPWWRVGEDPKRSNSANLFHLARTGYVGIDQLACAGNPLAPTAMPDDSARDWRRLEEVSYSYRIMFGSANPGWNGPASTVVMTDRSPVVLRAVAGQPIDPRENSPNHRALGQHALHTDGSMEWIESPVLDSGDNIWLPRGLERIIDHALDQHNLPPIHGTEVPASVEDAFVGP